MTFEDIKRQRSSFRLEVIKNDDGTLVFLANKHTYRLIDIVFSEIKDLSPIGWAEVKAVEIDKYRLWIPKNRIKQNVVERFLICANVI